MFAFRELVHAHREDLAALIVREHGKVFDDAMGEVQRGLEVAEFACGVGELLKGGMSAQISRGVDSYSLPQPVGVAAGITPVQLPGDGAHVDVPGGAGVRQRVRAQAVRAGPVGVADAGRPAGRRRGCPRARSTWCTATARRSTRC